MTIKYPTPQEVRLIDGDFVDEPEQSLHAAHVSVALLIRQPEQLPPYLPGAAVAEGGTDQIGMPRESYTTA